MDAKELLNTITAHYLGGGREFNGYPLRQVDLPRDELDLLLVELVEQELVSLNFATYHPNPYVKAFPPEPVADQLRRLAELGDLTHLTAYPEVRHLETVIGESDYADRPFTRRMALGSPELIPLFFDLTVLETYRNDPRYYYNSDDTQGWISVTNEFYEAEQMRESDRVLIETFGFAYDSERQRAVCAFPLYLHRLSPEHQQTWAGKELDGEYFAHPAYSASVLGEWPDKVSIFHAFTEELNQLQRMSEAAGLPPIVRRAFQGDEKPANFSFLIRPTLRELQDFHATLDKLMSDNLNQEFFAASELGLEREITRGDGRIEVQRKGTIALLEEWSGRINFPDPGPKDAMLATFREVRRLRQRPAHAADDNRFDQAFFAEQRDLVIRAYGAVRTLRLILANHPALGSYDGVPDWLFEGNIYTF